jgi:hypothetical protein
MKLTNKAQAEAFVFFMESEKLRHFKDIRQIDGTVSQVCSIWDMERPVLDPNVDYWVSVVPGELEIKPRYPRNPINADEG